MIKRPLCLLLALVMLLSLAACSKEPEQTATTLPVVTEDTAEAATQPTEATVPAEPGLQKADYARILKQEDLDLFPTATDDMSKEDLRQLCQNFLLMQLSMYWKPDTDITFVTTNYKKGTEKSLTTDTQYAGIVYHSKGFGNVYRMMEYYDETTGIFALEQFLADHGGYGEGAAITDVETDESGNITYKKYRSLMALGNQCTSATCWSWGRAINSVAFGDTCDLTVANGFIPVGCYTYGYTHEGKEYGPLNIKAFGKKSDTNPTGYDTPDVIRDWNAANGADAMFKCYAQLKPGDLLVDEGHALMVESVNLYKNKAGQVGYDLSTITVNEQIEAWHYTGEKDGTPFKQQGGVGRSYSFKQLQDDGYIPFTFPELLDENDPQDKIHLDHYYTYADQLNCIRDLYTTFPEAVEESSVGIEQTAVYCSYEGDRITVADFEQMVVGSNYSISDVFVTVADKDGNELLKNVYRSDFTAYREISMTAQKCTWEQDSDGNYLTICAGLAELANGENTVTVTMQVSSGKLMTAYTGILAAE